ncbi:class I mannose-6-phosphate isomerase [Vibrio sp. MA40-2]|uniref:class I mannose-6-phosphate isomerase n=1 Tax=Vibrio sp. MA40-2 TaxID=3391828 RepID=UPI0039A65879
MLDQIANVASPEDNHFPEDWIGSTTQATNKGREHLSEGVSSVIIGGEPVKFDCLIDSDPNYFLGAHHVDKFGNNPMLLVKYLDSSVRLHFQVHPTAEFAQESLNSPCGKAEAYYVLQAREEVEQPYIYLGFQHPPERDKLKSMIEVQDIDAISDCFEKIEVKPGDSFYIPGGVPHAIGEGLLIIEIMEPSDLAVRFEFEKSGYVMPEEARFMSRDLDFCLDVFNFEQVSKQDVYQRYQQTPLFLTQYNEQSHKESLVDSRATKSFRVCKSVIKGVVDKSEPDFYIGLIVNGECTITCGGEQTHLTRFDKFFCPHGIDSITIESSDGVEILECYPPLAE